MEKLIASIQGLCSTADDLKQAKTALNNASDLLTKNAARLLDALTELDPGQHSLGYVYFLAARAAVTPIQNPQMFITMCSRVMEGGDPAQLRLAGSKLADMCRAYTELCVDNQVPKAAIRPLQIVIRKTRKSTEHLMPQHGQLMLVCLLSKCYFAATSVLQYDILNVDTESGLVPKDMLLYYYYGAMIYIGLKRFTKAMECFTLLFTMPASAVSTIMIEACKKFVLVSLIETGKSAILPRHATSLMQRHFKALCAPYNELAVAYGTASIDDLKKAGELNAEVFLKDNNAGLVGQVIASLVRRNIQRLTQTFLTLSLADIAQNVGLRDVRDAESHVLAMIEDGHIFATINQRDGMVQFNEDPERYNTTATMEVLDAEIRKSVALAGKLTATDEEVSATPQFIYKTQVQDRGNVGGGAGRWQGEEAFMDDGAGKGVSATLQGFLNKE